MTKYKLEGFGPLDKFALWSRLRAVGNSPAAKATVVMPLAGYLILLNQNFLNLADVDARFKFLAGEIPWRLVAVYFGTFFLGLGSLVYGALCPYAVKRHESAIDYHDKEIAFHRESPAYALQLENHVLERALTLIDEDPRDAQMDALERHHRGLGGLYATLGQRANTLSMRTDVNSMLYYFWQIENVSRSIWRQLCAGSMCLGSRSWPYQQ